MSKIMSRLLYIFRDIIIFKGVRMNLHELKMPYQKIYNIADDKYKELSSEELVDLLDDEDYDGILRVFNLKNALIPNSKVCEETGVRSKEEYRKLVITLLKKNDENSETIRNAIKSKIITAPIC